MRGFFLAHIGGREPVNLVLLGVRRGDTAVNEIPEQIVASQLSAGEKLLWSGRPRQGIMLRPSDAFVIPFSLLWCGFAIFWEAGVINSKAPIMFQLWGIPFVLVGLYFVFGRFIVDARQRARTFYGLTSQRVIIISGIFTRQVKSLNLRTLTDVSLAERSNGLGTISFGAQAPWWVGSGLTWPGMNTQLSPAFEGIDHPRDVYERLRTAQSTA